MDIPIMINPFVRTTVHFNDPQLPQHRESEVIFGSSHKSGDPSGNYQILIPKTGLMVRYNKDQPGLTIEGDLVKLEGYTIGIIDCLCPEGFMRIV